MAHRRARHSTLSQENELDRLANEYLRTHAANPLDVTQGEWVASRTFTEARQKQYALQHTNYNPNLVSTQFHNIQKGWDVRDANNLLHGRALEYSRPQVIFDIETDDYNRPIAVSAIKMAFNKATGQLEVIDTFQRYYKSLSKNLTHTYDTHGLTPQILNKLRRQQGADYAWTYNRGEEAAFQRFVGNSTLVGHNIQEFDLKHVFRDPKVSNQVVDTLIASRNIWGDNGKNGLAQVFQRVFGMTMEQAGLPHHEAMSDSIATAMVYQAMANSDTATGHALRRMLKHGDLNLAPLDTNIDEGSQLIKGKYWEISARNYIDKYGLNARGAAIMSDIGKTLDEQIGEVLGTSTHIIGNPASRGFVNPDGLNGSDVALAIDALTGTIDRLKDQLGVIQSSAVDIMGFGSTMSQYRKAQYIQLLAKGEYGRNGYNGMKDIAQGLGIPSNEFEDFRVAATAVKQQSAYNKAFTELRNYTRRGLGNTQFARELRRGLADSWGDWGAKQTSALERDQQYFEEMEAYKKRRYLRKLERNGSLSRDQVDSLDLSQSYDDLVDATDALVKKNKELLSIYGLLGQVRLYNPMQYWESMKGQISGISSASRGVIPEFMRNPASRLAAAFTNGMDARLTPLTAFQRIWNSGVGNVVTGVGGLVGGVPGAIVGQTISGIVNTSSQLYGNTMQAKMERRGFEIQNNLNTLGAITDWVTTPFKLLYKATKTLTSSFSGLTLGIRSFMTNGLNAMSQMGNPLTELTGLNYAGYQGASMMDVASLFSRGSMNETYNDFVNQAKALYTTGDVNTGRMVASSMLGIFDQVYNPNASAGTYNEMVNSLLSRMQGQSAAQQQQTMYLASQIDKNLPSLLRTARMLNVTDINQLTDPTGRGMYWRPIRNGEEQNFRWDQYEYGAFREQWGVTKMRVADSLWRHGGKSIFNGFNRIMDSAATSISSGDWTSTLEQVRTIWEQLRSGTGKLWEDIKKVFNFEDIGKKAGNFVARLGIAVLELSKTILNVWDQLILTVLDKAQGLISYLSTTSFEVKRNKDGSFSFDIKNINDQEGFSATNDYGKAKTMNWDDTRGKWLGYGALSSLANQIMTPGQAIHHKGAGRNVYDIESIRQRLYAMADTGRDPQRDELIDLPEFGIYGYYPASRSEVDDFLDRLVKGDNFGTSMGKIAAFYGFDPVSGRYTPSGMSEKVAPLFNDIESTYGLVTSALQNELGKTITLDFKVDNKPGGSIMLDDDGKVVTTSNMPRLAQLLAEGFGNAIKLVVDQAR